MDPQNQQLLPQPTQPTSPVKESPKLPPDEKTVEALLAITRAQMEQDESIKQQLRAAQPRSFMQRALQIFNPQEIAESPAVRRRLVIFIIITIVSAVASVILGGGIL